MGFNERNAEYNTSVRTSLLIVQVGVGFNERNAEHNTSVPAELSERGELLWLLLEFCFRQTVLDNITILVTKCLT